MRRRLTPGDTDNILHLLRLFTLRTFSSFSSAVGRFPSSSSSFTMRLHFIWGIWDTDVFKQVHRLLNTLALFVSACVFPFRRKIFLILYSSSSPDGSLLFFCEFLEAHQSFFVCCFNRTLGSRDTCSSSSYSSPFWLRSRTFR